MLRIKKEYLNEEELKKYGFVLSPITRKHYMTKEPKLHLTINEYGDIRMTGHTFKEYDFLYDLITSGIVEKSPYERRRKKNKEQQKIDKAIEILNDMKIDNSSACRQVLDILKGE